MRISKTKLEFEIGPDFKDQWGNLLTFDQFKEKYPTDELCLNEVFRLRFGHFKVCPQCRGPFRYKRVASKSRVMEDRRKSFQCSQCAHQIYPLEGTIYEKTRTPLTYWFYTMHRMATSGGVLNILEQQCEMDLTYKTIWRMYHSIRGLMGTGWPLSVAGQLFIPIKKAPKRRQKNTLTDIILKIIDEYNVCSTGCIANFYNYDYKVDKLPIKTIRARLNMLRIKGILHSRELDYWRKDHIWWGRVAAFLPNGELKEKYQDQVFDILTSAEVIDENELSVEQLFETMPGTTYKRIFPLKITLHENR